MRCFVSSRRKKVERYQFVLVEFVCKMSFNRIWRQTAILSLSLAWGRGLCLIGGFHHFQQLRYLTTCLCYILETSPYQDSENTNVLITTNTN